MAVFLPGMQESSVLYEPLAAGPPSSLYGRPPAACIAYKLHTAFFPHPILKLQVIPVDGLTALLRRLTLMPLVASLVDTNLCIKPGKWLKPWQMGIHLRVLGESFQMNTNMIGLRWFSWFFVHWTKVSSAAYGLTLSFCGVLSLCRPEAEGNLCWWLNGCSLLCSNVEPFLSVSHGFDRFCDHECDHECDHDQDHRPEGNPCWWLNGSAPAPNPHAAGG